MEYEDENSPLPLDMAQRIDAACDRFEAELRQNKRASIEAFLHEAPAADRPHLLRELIILEIDFRYQQGESFQANEYKQRFEGIDVDWLASSIDRISQLPKRNSAADTPTITPSDKTLAWDGQQLVHYFGDYELLSEIARGGMGVVYRARQVSLDRTVAIKRVLSGNLASRDEIERFYAEARMAAQLDHPNIVPLFEVGNHDGQHYLSMGFVEGSSLDRLTTDVLLEPREAARIMVTVARAVQYAHEHGIIHRDLKPSNILIDKSGTPKITDFGLAKRLDEKHGQTVTGQVLGTPSYMPPEQAAGKTNAVGPHSDIYSLGAVLYVLLTGRPPFKGASVLQTLSEVLAKEPIRPKQLNSNIPRDLETIVLKCLEKSIPRRYATAAEVADELQRFLEGRPIAARPIGKIHRAWRWCRRNPVVASLVGLLAVSLISGTAISSGYAWSNSVLAASESSARTVAENQRDIAQGLNEMLTRDILGQVDIWNQAETETNVDPNITVKATLDRSASRAAERFAGRPQIESAVRRALGSAYFAMGEHDKAIQQLERSLNLVLDSPNQTLEEHRLRVETQYLLAKSFWLAHRPQDADTTFRAGLKDSIESLGPNSRERLVIQTSLAFIHLGRDSEALTLLEELQPIVHEYFKPGDIDVLHFQNTLGLAQQRAENMPGALATFTAGHAQALAALGEKNPLTMMLLNNRARWYLVNKQPAQALEIFQQLEPLVAEQLGPDNPNTILTQCNLSFCYLNVGQFEQSVSLLEKVAPAMQAGLGPNNPQARAAKLALAKGLQKLNRHEEAAPLYYELWVSITPDQSPPEIIEGLVALTAERLQKAGRAAQLKELVKAFEEVLASAPESMDNAVATESETLASLLLSGGEMEMAEQWARRAVEVRNRLAAQDWQSKLAELLLAEVLLTRKQNEQALSLLSRAMDDLEKDFANLPPENQSIISRRVEVLVGRLSDVGLTAESQSLRQRWEK